MFETLSKGFRQARNRLAGLTELTDGNVDPALREVRLSLLEADVEIGVVKAFLARVKQKAIGQTLESRVKHQGETHKVSASDIFIKICHDELEGMMDHEGEPIAFAASGPTGIMMVGLQGAGKTTTCAKLARLLEKQGKKPLLVAADMQRPAAVEQLKVLGDQLKNPRLQRAGRIPRRHLRRGARGGEEAGPGRHHLRHPPGRLAIDEPLMAELAEIKAKTSPENIFLVVDAMIGQDAVKTSRSFHDRLKVSGVVLTKLDGDARGGRGPQHQGGHRRPRRLRRYGRDDRQARAVPRRGYGEPHPGGWATSSA